jgi:uncharacterized membrane protein
MADDETPQYENGGLTKYRLAALEASVKAITDARAVESRELNTFMNQTSRALDDIKRVVDRLDTEKIARVISAAEQEEEDIREKQKQTRSYFMSLVIMGITGPTIVLIIAYFLLPHLLHH